MDESRIPHRARSRGGATSLLGDWLELLGVRHTEEYIRNREQQMPFKTWFGLKRVLEDYGVDSTAFSFSDKSKIMDVPVPFIAHTGGEEGGNVIVTAINSTAIDYLSLGQPETTSLDQFTKAWDGNVFISQVRPDACEPEYSLHHRLEFFTKAKKWVMMLCGLILLVYAFVANGLYNSVAPYFIAALDIWGIYVTYLLVQKSLKIRNPKADRFCGIIQAGGCDDILATSASKFFGLFGWSEVGFAYFSVSLLTLLMFPSALPGLALCNLCCLPFTAWSVWYQHFRAKRWCTLCLTVQGTLWLLFFSYLAGGYERFTLVALKEAVVLGFAYLGTMLLINSLMPLVNNEHS